MIRRLIASIALLASIAAGGAVASVATASPAGAHANYSHCVTSSAYNMEHRVQNLAPSGHVVQCQAWAAVRCEKWFGGSVWHYRSGPWVSSLGQSIATFNGINPCAFGTTFAYWTYWTGCRKPNGGGCSW